MKTCSKCSVTKEDNLFVKGKKCCLECHKKICKERYEKNKPEKVIVQTDNKQCIKCLETKNIDNFVKGRNVCRSCWNIQRKELQNKYHENSQLINKKCTICEITKDGTKFKYSSNICKECTSNINSELEKQHNNKDLPNKVCNNCHKNLPGKMFRYQENSCRSCEKERLYKWRLNNPEKFQDICKKYRSKPEYRDKQNEYKRNRYQSNDQERLRNKYRQVIRDVLSQKCQENELTKELLGCNIDFFKKWLEHNFKNGMTWDNYGSYWHMDHIRACSSFDMTDIEERNKCFHWSNVAPLEGILNLKKFDKIDETMIEYYDTRALQFDKYN